ncbi:MAG: pyruvate kinase, partial [Clostridia bacterium]
MRKTKIICTIGPACNDEKTFSLLAKAGLNVARLNFSHGDYETHKKNIDMIKKVRAELNLPIAILLDTKGPEVRIRTFENGGIDLAIDDIFTFTSRDVVGNQSQVSVTYKDLEKECFVGDKILLNNGLITFEVVDVTSDGVKTKVVEGGRLTDRKSMNFPNKVLNLPYLSEIDKADLLFGIENDVDFVACSFVSNGANIASVREFINSNGGSSIDLIAKIENRSGVDNIEEILPLSDGIMVARGDMGVEIPYEELPAIQKALITQSRIIGKRVITATEMLESMISNPRPTRAEISDVANAVYDGTSAIMLSGETAVGKYPIEALKSMAKIAEQTEKNINYKKRFKETSYKIKNTVDAVSHSTCNMSMDIDAKAIVVCTLTGSTARMVSRFRTPTPILALTTDEKVYRKLNLSWGVTPGLIDE